MLLFLQSWCEKRNYDPDDLGENQLCRFADHLQHSEVTYDTCRSIASALGWKQGVLERTCGKTWTARPAETSAFRDLNCIKAHQKRNKLQNGGSLAAVAKQIVSDSQLDTHMKLCLESP